MCLRIVCVFLFACVSQIAVADDPVPEAELPKQLVGTWKMVSAKFGGEDSDLPTRLTVLKHITPTHMTWMRSDQKTGEVVAMASGTWTISGDKFSDTPTMGMGSQFKTVKGRTHTFTCRIEGDKWFHTGKLDSGLTIEEVWERQKAETESK